MEESGLRDRLNAAGMTTGATIAWADEMRIRLIGTTRRVWGRRGVKVRQRKQIVYDWRYLSLVVDPASGRFWTLWSHTMQAPVARVVVVVTKAEAEVAALV